jgi:hypothetical protein
MQVKAKCEAKEWIRFISRARHRGQPEDKNTSFPGGALNIDFSAMGSGNGPGQTQPQARPTGCPTLVTSKEPGKNPGQIFSVDADARYL